MTAMTTARGGGIAMTMTAPAVTATTTARGGGTMKIAPGGETAEMTARRPSKRVCSAFSP
jgi:hypothetical protein